MCWDVGGRCRLEAEGERFGRLDRESERLLEEQPTTGFGRAHGELSLDVRGDRECEGINGGDQLVDVRERLRTVGRGERSRLGPIAAPDPHQLGLRMSRDPGRVNGLGPEPGTNQAEPQPPLLRHGATD